MKIIYLTLWFALVSATIAQADDAEVIKVHKTSDGRIAMTQPQFTGGDSKLAATINSVVGFDMKACGYFKVSNAGTETLVVSGKIQNDTVECTVTRRDKGETIFSRRYNLAGANEARRISHQISDDIVEAVGKYTRSREPFVGIAQTRIAFIYKKNGVSELAVMDYDGYNVTVLTRDSNISARPRWVNERQIVYMSYKSGSPAIYLVDLTDNSRKRITSFPGLNTSASPSPDGRRMALVLSKDGNPELYMMAVSGGEAKRLTRTPGGESSPCWSPDGRQIAYVSDDRGTPQVYVMSAAGGEPTRLTRQANYNTEPDWSPRGNRLIITSRVGGMFQLALVDAASGTSVMLNTGGGDAQDATWSPNGKVVVFGKAVNYHSTLMLMDVDSDEPLSVPTALDGQYLEPAWGPGRK